MTTNDTSGGQFTATTTPAKPGSRIAYAVLAAIVLLALWLRLYRLDALSLWYDEGATLVFSQGGYQNWIADNHPPLYYALMNGWRQFGQSEYWLRLLSVIPAVATIPVVFALGKRMFGINAGLLASAFMATMAFHIIYSQEARMYALLVFLYASMLWALVAAARGGGRRHWLGYTVAAVLLAYTQGIGIVYVAIVASLFPFILPRPLQGSAWRPFLVANGAVALIYFPWLLVLSQSALRLDNIAWITPPALTSIEKILTTLMFERIPVTGIVDKLTGIGLAEGSGVILMSIPVILLVGIGIWRAGRSSRGWAAATAILAVILPILAVYVLSILIAPMYLNRVLLPVSIGFVLLLSASVQGLTRSSSLVWLLIAVNLVISCANTFYAFRYSSKEDYRSLSLDLQRRAGPEDAILFLEEGRFGRALVEYYDRKSRLAATTRVELSRVLSTCTNEPDSCLETYFQNYLPGSRLWIIYVHDHVLSPGQAVAKNWFDQHSRTVSEQAYPADALRLREARLLGP